MENQEIKCVGVVVNPNHKEAWQTACELSEWFEWHDIEVVGNTLVVRGEKKLARDEVRGRYHVMERAYGQFERAIRLPAPVDDSKAKARYRAGVLAVTLPRLKPGGSNRITVH